mgnify:CR=1 FL=1
MTAQITEAQRLSNLELQIFGGPNVNGDVSDTDIPGLLADVELLVVGRGWAARRRADATVGRVDRAGEARKDGA